MTVTGANNVDIAGTLTVVSNRTLTNNSTGTFSLNDIDLSSNSARLFSITSSADTTVSGVISNAGRIRKLGASTLTLSSANTYTGDTILSGGTVVTGNNAAFGTSRVDLNSFTLDGGAAGRVMANETRLNGNFRFGGTADIELSGNMTLRNNRNLYVDGTDNYEISGNVFLGDTATDRTLTVRGAGDLTISGDIQNGTLASAGRLTKSDAGTLTFSGTN